MASGTLYVDCTSYTFFKSQVLSHPISFRHLIWLSYARVSMTLVHFLSIFVKYLFVEGCFKHISLLTLLSLLNRVFFENSRRNSKTDRLTVSKQNKVAHQFIPKSAEDWCFTPGAMKVRLQRKRE